MRQVERIDSPKESDKPVEFTHILDSSGWGTVDAEYLKYDRIVYLGECIGDGDMFAAYSDGLILIYKGHLNSGKY